LDNLVIFAHHHNVIDALVDHFGSQAVVLDGRTPNESRQQAVDRFQTDPTIKVFIGGIKAAGIGITLTAATHVVFAELDWVPANISQAEDRCHRIGQAGNVVVQHLVMDGSLDARLAKVLVWKQKIIEQALDQEAPKIEVPEAEQARLPRIAKYPVASETQRKSCAVALLQLAETCDGAFSQDGMGFNKFDSRIGKQLASRSLTRLLTDGEVHLCKRMLPKYHGQIGEMLVAGIKG